MYSVYINHFKNPGSANEEIIDTEELMFTVPGDGPFHIIKPSVKSTEDSADNFSFSMESNSMYYDSILPLKTMFRVEYDGDIIFYGRALAPSTSSVFHTKNVTCEGKYVFLNDTYYEGKQESHRSKITISDYYDRIIDNHNAMAPTKPFARGIVEVELPDKTEKYEPTSWSQSFSLIGNLTSGYGGHIRARYEGETVYLDWYKYYLRDLGDGERPSVEIGKNILDISSETRIDDIFSRLIPIGDTNKDGKPLYLDGYEYEDKDGNTQTFSGKVFPVSMIRDLYTDEELTDEFHDYRDYRDVEDNFGVIYKTMSFGDCDTQKKLFDETKKWIKEAYFGLATSFSVKAVDFHLLDNAVPKILLGDCVDVSFLMTINGVSTRVTKKLVCKSVTYDLYNPENNMYTFGIPTDVLNKNRDRKSSKNTVSDTTAPKPNPTSREEEDKTVTWEKVWRTIGDKSRFDPDYDPQFYGDAAFDSFERNGELEGTVYCVDPDEIETGDPQELFEKRFRARLIGLITISEYTPKWVACSDERGVFAYTQDRYANNVVHWYVKEKGYTYEASDPGISTFDKIESMIAKDTDSTYGGSTVADQFRANGRLSGSAKVYDPDKVPAGVGPGSSESGKYIFQVEIIGKFGSASAPKHVGISSEYGVCAFTKSPEPSSGQAPTALAPNVVKHWYSKAKGITYNNVNKVVTEDKSGSLYLTGDETPEGKKTIIMEPTTLSEGSGGEESQGQIKVGYDLNSQDDKWKIKLNVPIQFQDADGNTVIADGAVSASDFGVEEIPSFKTKLGIFDVVIAGKVEAAEVDADLAYLRKLNSETVTAGTRIASANAILNTVVSTDITSSNYHYNYYADGSMHNMLLQKCFHAFEFSESSGTITLSMYKIDGSGALTDSFNMADTTFYRNAVSAAKNSIGLTSPTWDNNGNPYSSSWTPTSRTITVKTTGKDNNDSVSQWIGIEKGSWSSSGVIYVYIYKDGWPSDSTPGTRMAGLSIQNVWTISDDITLYDTEPTTRTYFKTYETNKPWGDFAITVNNQTRYIKIHRT